jgi:hypothetical protein
LLHLSPASPPKMINQMEIWYEKKRRESEAGKQNKNKRQNSFNTKRSRDQQNFFFNQTTTTTTQKKKSENFLFFSAPASPENKIKKSNTQPRVPRAWHEVFFAPSRMMNPLLK